MINHCFTLQVTLTHHRTGLQATVNNWATGHKSWHKLVAIARRILAAKVAAYDAGMYPVSDRLEDRVRTYHTSPYGTWTKEYRSGVRVDGAFLTMGDHDDKS